jgi:protein-S-isoprenylcysteine O-methyltransferase Ste14
MAHAPDLDESNLRRLPWVEEAWREGRAEMSGWRFRRRGWIALAVFLPAVSLVMISTPATPPGSWLAIAMAAASWPVLIAGGLLRLWSTLYIGGRKAARVVSEGPYSVCRNPLYVGTFLAVFSAGLFLDSIVLCTAAVVVLAGYASIVVPIEERVLRRRFGAVYDQYCASVPRLLPRPRAIRSPRRIEIDVNALAREFRKTSAWLLIPLFAALTNALRLCPWWPHWLVLP